jgi:antitoxin component of MazEF toxin-antitoxin module
MKRNLYRAGNGWSLFLPKVIIELLKIDPENDTIEMEIENEVLKIRKSKNESVDTES